ncbi:MAG: hypothetical protein HZC47_10535 [Methanobacterium sp.]|uniref:hypothetical protein n=1 Tax=Methanobacterium sp. TaxID=2164 RepID=UPI003D6521F9|nr:hypothetical protein [Methanobacterium sp.]
MKNNNNDEKSNKILDNAYKCKPNDLEQLLHKIESEIKNSAYVDNILLRAKTVVTSKIALMNSK